MPKGNRPRTPSALSQPLAEPAAAPAEPAAPQMPPPGSAEEAVKQCLVVLEQNKVSLRDGSPVTQEMLPSVLRDLIGLWGRTQVEAQQLRATLKSVL